MNGRTAGPGGALQLHYVGDNNRSGDCSGPGYQSNQVMVQNVSQELDAPGEWFYDAKPGRLSFYPPSGTDLAKATVQTAELNELIHVEGTSMTQPAHHITFTGLHLANTHRTLFNGTYEPLAKGDWSVVRSGAVYEKNAKNITVNGSIFDQLGGGGVFMDGYNEANVVSDNKFESDGAADVQVVGSPSAVRDYSDNYHHQVPITDTTVDRAGNVEATKELSVPVAAVNPPPTSDTTATVPVTVPVTTPLTTTVSPTTGAHRPIISLSRVSVAPGGQVTLTVDGLDPGALHQVVLHSTSGGAALDADRARDVQRRCGRRFDGDGDHPGRQGRRRAHVEHRQRGRHRSGRRGTGGHRSGFGTGTHRVPSLCDGVGRHADRIGRPRSCLHRAPQPIPARALTIEPAGAWRATGPPCGCRLSCR